MFRLEAEKNKDGKITFKEFTKAILKKINDD